MGWIYKRYNGYGKPKTMKEKKDIVVAEVRSWYRDGVTILHDHFVYDRFVSADANGYVYYCSIEKFNQHRAILVTLVIFDDDGWGYKDMDETECPGYCDCPLIILKDVPCPAIEYAIQWRKGVMQTYYNNNAKKAAIKALKPGDEIEFTEVNYGGCKKFKVSIIDGTNIYFASERGQCLNLVGWRKEDFKITKAN
jgi:hypothetical protein